MPHVSVFLIFLNKEQFIHSLTNNCNLLHWLEIVYPKISFVYSLSVLMCTTCSLFLLILLMLFVHHLFCFTCRLSPHDSQKICKEILYSEICLTIFCSCYLTISVSVGSTSIHINFSQLVQINLTFNTNRVQMKKDTVNHTSPMREPVWIKQTADTSHRLWIDLARS